MPPTSESSQQEKNPSEKQSHQPKKPSSEETQKCPEETWSEATEEGPSSLQDPSEKTSSDQEENQSKVTEATADTTEVTPGGNECQQHQPVTQEIFVGVPFLKLEVLMVFCCTSPFNKS